MTNYPIRIEFVPSHVADEYANRVYSDVMSATYDPVRGIRGNVAIPANNSDLAGDVEALAFFLDG